MSLPTPPTGKSDGPGGGDAISGAMDKLDKLKKGDPTSAVTDKAVDKLTNRKESDGAMAGATKDTLGGAAKGAIEGAKKGGLHGAAVGAAAGAGTAILKNKNSRMVLIAIVIALLIPNMMMGIGLLGMMNMGSSHAEELQLEQNGMTAAGLNEDETSAIRRAAVDSGVQWPILFALYKSQQTSGTLGLEVSTTNDGGGTKPLADEGTFSVGDKCAAWSTKAANYLHTHWGNNENGSGRIGCQRDEADSDHNSGDALDYMIVPTTESALGKEVATFLMMNAKALNIKYLIFEQHIWNPTRDAYGSWRSMESRGTTSADHYDHIHISFNGGEGTYDWPTTKPTISAADIDKAFGGEGSGGAVPGYEEFKSSGVAGAGLPFGLIEDTEGLPEDKVEGETDGERIYRFAMFVASKMNDAMSNDVNRGKDIGDGMAVSGDGKPYLQGSSEAQRQSLEESYTTAFGKLPVDGASNEQWRRNVWLMAMAYRMGQSFDACVVQPTQYTASDGGPAPTVPGSDPSASPSPSPSPSASPTTPALPADVKLPFKVSPSAAYPGNPSADYNSVMVDEAVLMNVAKVSAVAKELFPDQQQYERAMLIAVTAMLVETGGKNSASKAVPESLNYPHDNVLAGDYDSVGIFQQRVYTGYYGTAQQLMDPTYQAYMFFGAPKPLYGPLPAGVARRGLLQYGVPGTDIYPKSKGKNWMQEPIGEVTQTIQGSAHPDRYELWVQDAPKVIAAATGIQIDGMNPGGCIQSMDAVGAGGAMGIQPASGKVVSPIPAGTKGVSMSARYGRYPSGGKHFGVDMTSGSSWNIVSICDGTVKSIDIKPRYANSNAYKVSGSTNYIWIDCGNGVLMGYAHFFARDLNSNLKVGVQIGAGTPLFPVGNQGNSSGTHLHLQISTSNSTAYSREATVDPVAYLSQFGISLPKPGY